MESEVHFWSPRRSPVKKGVSKVETSGLRMVYRITDHGNYPRLRVTLPMLNFNPLFLLKIPVKYERTDLLISEEDQPEVRSQMGGR